MEGKAVRTGGLHALYGACGGKGLAMACAPFCPVGPWQGTVVVAVGGQDGKQPGSTNL